MDEDTVLEQIKRGIANIRYQAYILFEEDEQLSGEIEVRMSDLAAVVTYYSNNKRKTKIVPYTDNRMYLSNSGKSERPHLHLIASR